MAAVLGNPLASINYLNPKKKAAPFLDPAKNAKRRKVLRIRGREGESSERLANTILDKKRERGLKEQSREGSRGHKTYSGIYLRRE